MSRRKKILLITAVIAVAAIAAVVIINRVKISSDAKKEAGKQENVKFAVETGLSRLGDITDYIRINGDVVAARSIDIYPDASGKLKNILVSIGDHIENTQVIAEVDPSKPGLSYALSPVRSTIRGTVTSLPYESGATVTTSTPVATIGDLTLLQVEAEVSEQYTGLIGKGSRAEISFVAWPDKKFDARIVEVSPVVNASTRTMGVKLEFDRNYPGIKAGMFASIKLFTETKTAAVLVNSDAVVLRDGVKYLFIARENRAEMKKVETGLTVDGVTEIISGIGGDEEIVIKGQNLLDDGVEINVIKSGAAGGNGRS